MIELLIVAGLSLAVVAAIAATYVGTVRSWRGTAALADIQREGSLAVEVIAREIRPGSRVTIDGDADSLSVFFQAGSGDSLIAAFYLDDSGNVLDVDGGTVTTGVDSIRFTSADSRSVNIDIWLSNDVGTPDRSTDDQAVLMSTTAVCRN